MPHGLSYPAEQPKFNLGLNSCTLVCWVWQLGCQWSCSTGGSPSASDKLQSSCKLYICLAPLAMHMRLTDCHLRGQVFTHPKLVMNSLATRRGRLGDPYLINVVPAMSWSCRSHIKLFDLLLHRLAGAYAERILMSATASAPRPRQVSGVVIAASAPPGAKTGNTVGGGMGTPKRPVRLLLRCAHVVAACGALHTPALLLRSGAAALYITFTVAGPS